jgi:ubiquitin carboxyl-terminal hydrolase 34
MEIACKLSTTSHNTFTVVSSPLGIYHLRLVLYTDSLVAEAIDGTVLPQVTIWLDRLPISPPYWTSYFLDKHVFWDEFASLVNKILQRRAPFGDQFCDEGQAEDDVFTSFFGAYLRVCPALMQADAETLSQCTPEEAGTAVILSCRHIGHVSLILRREKPNVFGLLDREYGVDMQSMTTQLARVFVRADGIKSLLAFAKHACSKLAVHMLHGTAISITQLLDTLGWLLLDVAISESIDQYEFYQSLLQYFRSYSVDLQVPSKVTDIGTTKEMIGAMSTLLFDLCHWDHSIAAKLANELLEFRDPDSPTTPTLLDAQTETGGDSYLDDPSIFPALVMNAWKFKLLRKYLLKGRMELRVFSIGTMDVALVEIWKEYNITELSSKHPVMQYLAEFLLRERITDYLISVDSHPQLISRSGNVVGFLVVTNRYSESQTDAIWNTVSKSSDPRVVSATLTMLRAICNLMDIPALSYLCTKLYELPIESYNIEVLRFLRDLTSKLQQKFPLWSTVEFQARPWNVIVRVLQDTSPGKDTSTLLNAMHNEAFDQLYSVCAMINSDERHEICRQCATHIAGRSSKATGSVRAINVLTSMHNYNDALFFSQNPDVTRQILEETCAFVEEKLDITSSQAHSLQYRLDLLSFLVRQATDAIPVELYQDIWDHLVGRYAQSNQLRDMAWSKFLEASKVENNFCKQLVSVFVPKLEPQYYTLGLYEFVASYTFPTLRRTIVTPEGEKQVLQIRGADLLWSMVLSAPPHTIEDHAARLLAARYLELGAEPDVALDELEDAHVALVDQCMHELISAYDIMRTKSIKQESDEMDIASSDTVKQQKERRFTRTILFLKGLLMSIRTRPEFSRPRRSDSKVEPLDFDLPYGDALEIRYQGPTSSEKQSILVGLENTLQDLYLRLCQATGCSKINLFAKGQRVNVAEKANETIARLGLAGTFLLVQKAPGSEMSQPVTEPNRHCSVFEATLVDRFEELFACMDSDDSISVVVRIPSFPEPICLLTQTQLYDFLVCFPYPERIAKSVLSGTSSANDLFPPGKPLQSKYAANALHWKLREQVKKV